MQYALPDIELVWIADLRSLRTIGRIGRKGATRHENFRGIGAVIEDVAPAPVQKIKDIAIA